MKTTQDFSQYNGLLWVPRTDRFTW